MSTYKLPFSEILAIAEQHGFTHVSLTGINVGFLWKSEQTVLPGFFPKTMMATQFHRGHSSDTIWYWELEGAYPIQLPNNYSRRIYTVQHIRRIADENGQEDALDALNAWRYSPP